MKSLLFLSILFSCFWGQSQNIEDTCMVYVSNNLTRNDNSTLMIHSNCTLFNFKFNLYNKWGELYYESRDHQQIMNFDLYEKVQNNDTLIYKYQKNETFIWTITYTPDVNPLNPITQTGNIIIL